MKLIIEVAYEYYLECNKFVRQKVATLDQYVIASGTPYEERLQGEWIIVKDERYGDNVKCPFCGKELAGTDLNFCCKCGAKMENEGEATQLYDIVDDIDDKFMRETDNGNVF